MLCLSQDPDPPRYQCNQELTLFKSRSILTLLQGRIPPCMNKKVDENSIATSGKFMKGEDVNPIAQTSTEKKMKTRATEAKYGSRNTSKAERAVGVQRCPEDKFLKTFSCTQKSDVSSTSSLFCTLTFELQSSICISMLCFDGLSMAQCFRQTNAIWIVTQNRATSAIK